MRGFPTPEVFVDVVEGTRTVEGARLRFEELGYRKMTVRAIVRWTRTFREAGIKLRKFRKELN